MDKYETLDMKLIVLLNEFDSLCANDKLYIAASDVEHYYAKEYKEGK